MFSFALQTCSETSHDVNDSKGAQHMLTKKSLFTRFHCFFEQFHFPMNGKTNTKKLEQSLLPCSLSKCWVLCRHVTSSSKFLVSVFSHYSILSSLAHWLFANNSLTDPSQQIEVVSYVLSLVTTWLQ